MTQNGDSQEYPETAPHPDDGAQRPKATVTAGEGAPHPRHPTRNAP
jgi:hypothetical protein